MPSDKDFVTLLNDPAALGIRYLLAVPNAGRDRSDAVNLRYPTLSTTTAPMLRRWNWRPPMTVPINRTGGSTE